MVAACPFPANHGIIREMSDTLSELEHNIHIVTYPTGQEEIKVRYATVHRTAAFRLERNAKVGPSTEKFLLDFHLPRLLCRGCRRQKWTWCRPGSSRNFSLTRRRRNFDNSIG